MFNPVVRTVAAGLLGAGLLLGTPLALAQSAEPISFQARIDGVGDGLVQLSFHVFDTVVGGDPLNEEPIVIADASVVDGVVSVELPVSPLWFTGQSRYLGVTVDGEALADRIPIVSAPRALAARTLLDPNGESWLHWSVNQLIWTYEPGFANFDKWSLGQANITPGDLGFALRNLSEGSHPSGSESWLFVDQSTGFVGIGRDEPISPLHVWGDIRTGDDLFVADSLEVGDDALISDNLTVNSDIGLGDDIFVGGTAQVRNNADDTVMLFGKNTADGPFVEFTDASGEPVFRITTDGEGGGYFGLSKGDCFPQSALCPLVTLATTEAGGGFIQLTGGCADTFTASTLVDHPSNGFVSVRGTDQQGVCNQSEAGMFIDDNGDAVIFGDVKAFRMVNPVDPGTELWYAAPEGPEAATYLRGTALLIDGVAEVIFPDHFASVANPVGMTVQLTPLSADSLGLACVGKGVGGFTVRELHNGRGTYEFDWQVMCTRQGFEDYQVVRPRGAVRPQPASAPMLGTEGR